MKRRFLCGIVAVIGLISIFFSGCDLNEEKSTFNYGDFKYTYIDKIGQSLTGSNGDYIAILGLSIEAWKKETIIIPEEIGGRTVIQIGMDGSYQFSSISAYHKLYLPKTLKYIANGVENEDSKAFIIELDDLEMLTKSQDRFYFSSSLYTEVIEKYEDYKSGLINKANTEFIVDGKPYWIDDYDEESLITAPENPIKEGYEFLGWYKEPECENEWDFGTDKVKGKTYDESGEKNINLTTLYAKWQKI